MKTTFKSAYQWSDYSEFSPQRSGQLPVAVILPDGRRIDLSDEEIFAAAAKFARLHPTSRAEYTPIARDGVVKAKLTSWGDDGRRSCGSCGETLKVIAPKGSEFRFDRYCEFCGEVVNESPVAARRNIDRNGDAHPRCQEEHDAFLADKARLVAEAEKAGVGLW